MADMITGILALRFILHVWDELEEIVTDLGLHGPAALLPTNRIFSCGVRRVVLAAADREEHACGDKWVAGGAEVGDVVASRLVLTELAALC